jgi:hypothetical protein
MPKPATFVFGVNLDLAFHIAALLYLHIIIRELPHTAKMHHNALSHLASVLESFSPFISNLQEPAVQDPDTQSSRVELLAWVIFMGALAAEKRAERGTFVGMLQTVCATAHITTLEDIQSRLQRILWRAGVSEGFLEGLWGEMFADFL